MSGHSGPVRTCIGCRVAMSPATMIRVSVQGDRLSTDRTAGGRGAWLCPDITCFETAIKRRALPRALKTEVSSEALDELRTTIAEGSAFPPSART